jgi:radical SAM/Cys-rich protein
MLDTRPLLLESDFPDLRRRSIATLQVNLGYRCNLSCVHCHVNAGPNRSEEMSAETVDELIQLLDHVRPQTLDLTGGAPELNPQFRRLVVAARERQIEVVDRCNLTILFEPGQEDLAEFMAEQEVIITASLPCYQEDNVARQRGEGVYGDSIRALQNLNLLGYGSSEGGAPELQLNLVYNPVEAVLPPPQQTLEADYKRELGERFGICFNQLYTITNMPISRYGAVLLASGEYAGYMALLRDNFSTENLDTVMCRDLVSIDWQGFLYDCDFNQMLELPILASSGRRHLRDLLADCDSVLGPIVTGEHCYGCTAGQGSSCGGALDDSLNG